MKNQAPKPLDQMPPASRWEWFERQQQTLVKAAADGGTVQLAGDALKAYVYMMQLNELKQCEAVTMHHNAVVTMACAAIEKDPEMTQDWLLEALDQADCAEWQMYESAQEFFNRHRLAWPESQEDHRKNIAQNKIVTKQDSEKFAVWYEENVMPKLRGEQADASE